jgi:hypothetical protein
MFTVCHKGPSGEALFAAKSVTHLKGDENNKPSVMYTDPLSGLVAGMEFGEVFVMNEAGATVAKYLLAPIKT